MPKRQLILLVLMGLAVIYGGVNLLGGGDAAAPPAEARQEDLDKLVTQVQDMLKTQRLSDVERYRISLIGGEDVGDPLLKRAPGEDDGPGVASRTGDARFTYSAYLRFGDMVLAVVNDEECGEGDPVADTGYEVVAITRESATVQGSNPENGMMEKIVIPIREDILSFPEESETTAEEADAK